MFCAELPPFHSKDSVDPSCPNTGPALGLLGAEISLMMPTFLLLESRQKQGKGSSQTNT